MASDRRRKASHKKERIYTELNIFYLGENLNSIKVYFLKVMNISVKKLALLAIASVFSAGLWAQKKELTLDEVFLSPGKFKPEAYSGVQWSPSGAQWAHYDAETEELALETPKGYTSRVTASDLEKSLGKNVSSVPSVYSWKDYDNIYFEFPSYVVKYTLSAKKAEIVLSWDESIKGVHVSPVKDAVAYSKDGNVYYSKGGNTVRVSSDGGNGIVNGQSVHRNEFGIDRGIFFSPDGKKLAYYRKNESMVTPYPIVNTSSRIATVEEIPYPMAGEKSEEVELCIYDVQTGSSIRLEKRGAAEDYLTAVTWDPSGKYVYVAELTRDQKHMDFNKFDASTGSFVKTLFSENSDKWVEPEQPALFFKSRPGEFFWRSERDGNVHYYRYSTEGTLLGKATDGGVQTMSVIGLAGDIFYYTATADAGMDRTVKFTDLKTGKVGFVRSDKGTWNGFLDPAGKYMVCTFTDLNTPGRAELVALTKDGRNMGKTVRQLFEAKNPLAEYRIGQVKLGKIIKNNVEYNTRMVLPSNFNPAQRYPVLLYVYGGPHLQMVRNTFRGGADLWMHVLAEKGYVVFTMDNRGTPARGFDWESKIHRNLGKTEVADQMTGVEYLKNQSFVYPDRIAVYGWSYGGFMSLSLVTEHPGVFKVAVAGGPVIDWKWYEVMYTERYMDTPQDNREGYASSSLLDKVKKLTPRNKVLLIHGTADPTVVWQQSQEFVRSAVDNGCQVDYMIYPGHGHNVHGRDRLHLFNKIFSYITENNK